MTTPGEPNRSSHGDEPADRPDGDAGRSGGEGPGDTTQAFPVPGATPSYPGWEGEGRPGQEGSGSGRPSRYDPPTTPGPPVPEGGPGGYQGPGPYGGPAYGGGGASGGLPPYQPPPGQGYPQQPYGPYGEPKRGGGLGTASLVLGIVSLFLLFLCGLGVLTAIVGIILGVVAVAKRANRGRAWWGIGLGVLTLVLAVVAVTWFYSNFSECMNLPTQEAAQRCVEDKLGVGGTGQ